MRISITQLEHEVRLNHKRALGEMQFRFSAEKDHQAYTFLKLPEKEVQTVPEKGKRFISKYNIC